MVELTFAIPCHDGARHLPALLESLLGQEGVRSRLLLVDDASTDASVEIARKVAGDRLEVYRNPEPLGIPANWNRCASLVESEFFCLAHQDDVYHPRYGERLLGALRRDPEAVFAHCRAQAVDEEGRSLSSRIEERKASYFHRAGKGEGPQALALLFGGNWINCPSMLFRTEAFRRLGGFDERFAFVPDWEFSFRALLGGRRVKAIPEALVQYRRHGNQATRGAIEDLARYREELLLLDEVEAKAHERGLGKVLPRGRKAVRNNLLFDVYQDLREGQPALAKAKLRFGCEEIPGFGRDLLALGTRALAPLGRPGARMLGLGLALLLRLPSFRS